MGAGRPEIAERVTRSGLKMGWSSSVILVLFVGFPNNWSRSFSPAADPIFSEGGSSRRRHARLAGLYVTADAMMVVFSGALRGAGYLLDHVHLGRIALASAASALHPLKILQLSPQTAWLALVILFLSFSGVFYLRYRSGHWKTLTVVGEEADRVAGIRRRGFPDICRNRHGRTALSRFPPSIPSAARMPLLEAPVMPREVPAPSPTMKTLPLTRK